MVRTRCSGLPAALFVLILAWSAQFTAGEDVTAATDKPTRFYLVGMGPGDPDLITVRATRVLREVDVVFCSQALKEKSAVYLKGKQVANVSWRLFQYYGKDPRELEGEERRRCEEIAHLRDRFIGEVRRAILQGRTVAVLDRGDPLIYGPFAWCLEEFRDLKPQVVAGLSCFNAANAALRRGITTSEHTKSVILTATDWPGKTDTIDKLSAHRCTMVLFTMKAEFKEFIDKLSVNYPPQTPVAVVKRAGYLDKEEVLEGTLGTIADQVGEEKLPFEYLIYVGDFLTHRCKNVKNSVSHKEFEQAMCQLPTPRYQPDDSDPPWLAYAAQFHGHLGPWATAGLRAGMAGRRAVEAVGYFDLEVTIEGPLVRPPQSCFLDGVQVSTGATLGKRNLKWVDTDQLCVRVKNTRSGKTAEVRPTAKLTQLLASFKPRPKAVERADAGDHDDHRADLPGRKRGGHSLEALARQISRMPEKEIFRVE